MKRVVTVLLVIIWAAISSIGTLMPLPDELQFFARLPNSLRWLALLVVTLGLVALQFPRYFSWRGVKNLLRIGVSWEGGNWNFLGLRGSANPADMRVTGFQLRGFNNSRQTLKGAQARLIVPGGGEIPLRVTTSDGSMDHAASVDVAPRTKIYTNEQFSELTPDDFIASYAPMNFVFTWSDGESHLKFSRRAIDKQIRRFKKLQKLNQTPFN